MKRKILAASSALFALFLPFAESSATDFARLQTLADTRYHRLDARQIGRSFHVYVAFPQDYAASTRPYPTIFPLDGGGPFPMMASYARYLTVGEELPPAILVGISYGSDNFGGGNFRSTDYTAPSAERDHRGGAGRFQTFLAEDFLPLVERPYRADPDRRILFGQSPGGQFVLYSAMTAPDLFWARIASNPALHRNVGRYFFLTL